MNNGYLTYFEGMTRFYTNFDEIPSSIYQTIHSSESRINELLEMDSEKLENEYPAIVKMLKRKTYESIVHILNDEDDMSCLDLYNEE